MTRLLDLRAGVEPADHPADRRRLVRGSLGIDRAGHDQAIDRAGHRDVVETKALGTLLGLARLLHLLVGVGAAPFARHGIGDPEAEAPVGEREDLARSGRRSVTPCIRDDDDLELEPLRRVDRQQANRLASLLFGDGLELACTDGLLVANEADEALDVRSAQLLVGAREPRELAQICVTPPAVPLREHGQVVVVLGHDALTQALEREPRRRRGQPVVALAEGAQQLRVALGERLGQLAFERDEERTLRRRAAQQHEGVVRDADERRREHAHERLVVVAVAQQAQVREQIDDLLLAEVAAAGSAVGGDPQRA